MEDAFAMARPALSATGDGDGDSDTFEELEAFAEDD
jgi:hypothetical protein